MPSGESCSAIGKLDIIQFPAKVNYSLMTICLVEMPLFVKNSPARLATSLDPKVHYIIGSIHCFINDRWLLDMVKPYSINRHPFNTDSLLCPWIKPFLTYSLNLDHLIQTRHYYGRLIWPIIVNLKQGLTVLILDKSISQ